MQINAGIAITPAHFKEFTMSGNKERNEEKLPGAVAKQTPDNQISSHSNTTNLNGDNIMDLKLNKLA